MPAIKDFLFSSFDTFLHRIRLLFSPVFISSMSPSASAPVTDESLTVLLRRTEHPGPIPFFPSQAVEKHSQAVDISGFLSVQEITKFGYNRNDPPERNPVFASLFYLFSHT